MNTAAAESCQTAVGPDCAVPLVMVSSAAMTGRGWEADWQVLADQVGKAVVQVPPHFGGKVFILII